MHLRHPFVQSLAAIRSQSEVDITALQALLRAFPAFLGVHHPNHRAAQRTLESGQSFSQRQLEQVTLDSLCYDPRRMALYSRRMKWRHDVCEAR